MELPIKHSYHEQKRPTDWYGVILMDADGEWIVADGDLTEEDAAEIVRRVNAHDALVAALESVEWNDINVLKPICPACFSLRVIGHREHCPINAALKLAKEGQP